MTYFVNLVHMSKAWFTLMCCGLTEIRQHKITFFFSNRHSSINTVMMSVTTSTCIRCTGEIKKNVAHHKTTDSMTMLHNKFDDLDLQGVIFRLYILNNTGLFQWNKIAFVYFCKLSLKWQLKVSRGFQRKTSTWTCNFYLKTQFFLLV